MFTREQQKEAYRKLSPEVLDFIMSNETTELIDSLLKESGLYDELAISADSEVLHAMLGLQTLSTAIDKIAGLGNKNSSGFSRLKENLEKRIFSKIGSGDLVQQRHTAVEAEVHKPEVQQKERQSGVGDSYAEMILNQAKAMRPQFGSKETVVGSMGEKTGAVPSNLPTGLAQSPEDGIASVKRGEATMPSFGAGLAERLSALREEVGAASAPSSGEPRQDKLHTADKLPVENQNFAPPKYVPGKDPYREPAE